MSEIDNAGNADSANFELVKNILMQSLNLSAGDLDFDIDTELLGNIPEMDSMSVVTILSAIEEQFGFVIDDSETSAEVFETVGSLVDFVGEKSARQ